MHYKQHDHLTGCRNVLPWLWHHSIIQVLQAPKGPNVVFQFYMNQDAENVLKHRNTFTLPIISWHWDNTIRQKPSWWKPRWSSSHIINTMSLGSSSCQGISSQGIGIAFTEYDSCSIRNVEQCLCHMFSAKPLPAPMSANCTLNEYAPKNGIYHKLSCVFRHYCLLWEFVIFILCKTSL